MRMSTMGLSCPGYGRTSKTSFIPDSRCSAIWQWSIQRPGFDTSSKISAVDPTGSIIVSFQTRLSFGIPSCVNTRKRCQWMCTGCCMACCAERALGWEREYTSYDQNFKSDFWQPEVFPNFQIDQGMCPSDFLTTQYITVYFFDANRRVN